MSSINPHESLSDAKVTPLVFPSSGFTIIPDTVKLEEERYPWYKPESFYPVHIGEVFCSRYQVLYKIGHGNTSTVWICRDLERDQYVCMKAMVQDYPSVDRKLKAYEYLSKEADQGISPGKDFVRQKLDQFQLRHGDYNYNFLIHEPLGYTMKTIMKLCAGTFPMIAMAILGSKILKRLQLIHRANVIHGDISHHNILFTIHDRVVLRDLEEKELTQPSQRKTVGQRTIYASQKTSESVEKWLGATSRPIICDFGESRSGEDEYMELAQPPEYQAPEMLLRVAWSKPVDIWNFGVVMWYFATGEQLFPRIERDNKDYVDGIQLATMSRLFGLPPEEILDISYDRAIEFFDIYTSPKYEVPPQTLESRFASAFEGRRSPPSADQSREFIAFIRRVLIWDKDERPTVPQLFMDPWIVGK